jgi:hypothetical protein
MKKIIPILCASVLTVPAFAEETKAVEKAPAAAPMAEETLVAPAKEKAGAADKKVEAVVETKKEQKLETKSESDPEIKFPRGMQLGLGVSVTSGINGFVGYANKKFDSFWWKRLGVRFDFATTAPIESTINGTINTAVDDNQDVGDSVAIKSVDVTAHHMGLLVDFYPFGDTWFLGGWRLTGGYMMGKFGIGADLSGTINDAPSDPVSFEMNGSDYHYLGNAITGRATGTWKYSGPYMGTGFDLGLLWGVKIYMDAGAVYTNKTAVMGLNVPLNGLLEVSTDGGATWNPVEGTPFETQFNIDKQEALRDANDDLNKYEFFPMVKLGLMYRF